MDTITFISQSLRQVHQRLLTTINGLTQEKVLWRPLPHANNIGLILWHVARGEDRMINRVRGTLPDLWEAQRWYQQFGQPLKAPDPGDRMGLRALAIPALDILVGYLEDAYQQTVDYIPTLTPDELDIAPDPAYPDRTRGAMLRHLITHKNNHHGQIDYIRGLQDEMWDLPPGTGMMLGPS